MTIIRSAVSQLNRGLTRLDALETVSKKPPIRRWLVPAAGLGLAGSLLYNNASRATTDTKRKKALTRDLLVLGGTFAGLKTVLTIHNLAYQGHYGGRNQLAEGIMFADGLTTVSPTYAREIRTPQYGEGLDHLMRDRAADLGVDAADIAYFSCPSPGAADPACPARYLARGNKERP